MKQITQDKSNYIRVTEVLSPFSGLHNVPKDILENAGRRGTKVHEICENIIKGLGEWNIDHETQGYITSFKCWWDPNTEVLAQEQRFFCDDLKITGQVDLIINTPDGVAIVDFKTSLKESKTWPLQASAYAYLARQAGYDVRKIYMLHLFRDGSPSRLIEYEENFELYKSLLTAYKYFNPEKKNGKR